MHVHNKVSKDSSAGIATRPQAGQFRFLIAAEARNFLFA